MNRLISFKSARLQNPLSKANFLILNRRFIKNPILSSGYPRKTNIIPIGCFKQTTPFTNETPCYDSETAPPLTPPKNDAPSKIIIKNVCFKQATPPLTSPLINKTPFYAVKTSPPLTPLKNETSFHISQKSRRHSVIDFVNVYHKRNLKTSVGSDDLGSANSVPVESVPVESLMFRPFHEMPGPGGPPYFGTYFHYKMTNYKRYHEGILRNYKLYGKIYKETICGRTIVHILDPDMAQQVYKQEGRWPLIYPLHEKKKDYYDKKGILSSIGLLNGSEWARVRSSVHGVLMGPRFVSSFLPLVTPTIPPFLQALDHLINNNSKYSFTQLLSRWNLDASCMRILESRISMQSNLAEKIIASVEKTFEVSTKLKFSLPLHNFINTKSWGVLNEAEDLLHHEIEILFSEAIHRMKDSNDLDKNFIFLKYLLQRCQLKMEDIISTIISLLTDGLSTTVPTIIRQLYCLAMHPDKQDILYQEIERILSASTEASQDDQEYIKSQQDSYEPITDQRQLSGDQLQPIRGDYDSYQPINDQQKLGGDQLQPIRGDYNSYRPITDQQLVNSCKVKPISSEHLQQAVYLRACIKESFRLLPIAPEKTRFLEQDIVLGGYHIPAKTRLDIDTNMLLQSDEYFENAKSFRPERWLSSSEETKPHPYLLLPFSYGPRTCPGKRIAEQDIQLMLMELVRNYRITWSQDAPPFRQKYNMLLFPDQPPSFIFTRR